MTVCPVTLIRVHFSPRQYVYTTCTRSAPALLTLDDDPHDDSGVQIRSWSWSCVCTLVIVVMKFELRQMTPKTTLDGYCGIHISKVFNVFQKIRILTTLEFARRNGEELNPLVPGYLVRVLWVKHA